MCWNYFFSPVYVLKNFYTPCDMQAIYIPQLKTPVEQSSFVLATITKLMCVSQQIISYSTLSILKCSICDIQYLFQNACNRYEINIAMHFDHNKMLIIIKILYKWFPPKWNDITMQWNSFVCPVNDVTQSQTCHNKF